MQALGSFPAAGAPRGSPKTTPCSASGTAPTPLSPLPPAGLTTFHKLSSQHPSLPGPRTNSAPSHLLLLVVSSQSRRPGPGLRATLRGRAVGRDDQGGPSSGPLWLRMHLGCVQHHLHPYVLSGSRGGPAWTGGKGSDRLSVSLQKEKKKTYQVVCRRD